MYHDVVAKANIHSPSLLSATPTTISLTILVLIREDVININIIALYHTLLLMILIHLRVNDVLEVYI